MAEKVLGNPTRPSERNDPAVVKRDDPGRCPTCRLDWLLSPPAKCAGDQGHFRCIGCKAIYTTPMLAAPDMLAALNLVHAFGLAEDTVWTYHDRELLKVVRAAIAKATGAAS